MTINVAAGATPAGVSLITPTKPTPYEILCGLFGPEWAGNVHLASRTHDQDKGGWAGYRVSERFPDNAQLTLPENRDNYFSVGMQSRETRDRKGGNVILDYLIVLDDVGTKAPRMHAEGLRAFGIEPVMVLESSPGNFQYFYRLDVPVGRLDPDQKQRVAMIDIIRAALGQGLYSDGAVHDPSRYMRLPFGINTKPKYKRPDGSFPNVELIEWNPGARITLDQAGQAFVGADWAAQVAAYQPGQRPPSAATGGQSGDRQASMDHAYSRLAARVGLDPHYLRPGVVGARCPNAAAHTNGDPGGFAFINPYRAHCHHEHCSQLSAADFMDMIEGHYEEEVEAGVSAGQLFRDSDGTVRDKAGKHVPSTGRSWMAHDEFAVVHPLSVSEIVAAEKASATYFARRTERPEELRGFDTRYCLCPTIEGVIDLEPVAAESVHFNVVSKTHFKTLLDRKKINVNGKPRGAGSAWLEDPNSPLYEAIGCWPVGHEPPRTLNLWQGIDGAWGPLPANATCDTVLRYLNEVIAGGRDIVREYALDWLAWKLQNPLKKHGVNLVLIGQQGTGKSTLGMLLISMLGPKFAMAISNEQHLLGHFNAHLEGKLFLLVDEALFGKNPAIAGRYKALTTEDTLVVERKGVDARTVQNMLSLLVCSNSLAGVPIEPGDRRATVIEVSDAHRNDTAFFRALWAEWQAGGREAFIQFLLMRDVSQYEPRLCLATPEKAHIAETTADPATRYWLDRLHGGASPNGKDWTQRLLILNRELEADYIAWAEMNKAPRLSRSELSRRIGQLCPFRTKDRLPDGAREWGNTYPSREECLRLATAALGGDPARPPVD